MITNVLLPLSSDPDHPWWSVLQAVIWFPEFSLSFWEPFSPFPCSPQLWPQNLPHGLPPGAENRVGQHGARQGASRAELCLPHSQIHVGILIMPWTSNVRR